MKRQSKTFALVEANRINPNSCKVKVFDKNWNLRPFVIVRLLIEMFELTQKSLINGTNKIITQNHLTRGNSSFKTVQQKSVIDFFNKQEMANQSQLNITVGTVFGQKYKSLHDAQANLLGKKNVVMVQIPPRQEKLVPSPSIRNFESDIDKLNEFMTSETDQIFLLRGKCGTGKTLLLSQFVDRSFEQLDFKYSIVSIDPSKFSTIDLLLEGLYKILLESLRSEMSQDVIAKCAQAVKTKETIFDALAILFQQRDDWLLLIDSDRSWTEQDENIYYRSIRDTDLSQIVENILSLNTFVDRNLKIITVTNDVSMNFDEAVMHDISTSVNEVAFQDSLFAKVISTGELKLLDPDAAYKMALFNKIMQCEFMPQNSQVRDSIAIECFSAINSGQFDSWFYQFLVRNLPATIFDAICIASLPEDDLFESSLAQLLRLEYVFRKTNFPTSKQHNSFKNEQDYIRQHIKGLHQVKGVMVSAVDEKNEITDKQEKCISVHPLIKRSFSQYFGKRGTPEFAFKKRTHYYIGLLAYRYYEVLEESELNSVRNETAISSLSLRQKRLVQAVRHLIMSIQSHQTDTRSRHFITKSESTDILTTIDAEELEPEDRLNIAWNLLKDVMKELDTHHNMWSCELKYNLLAEVINCGRDKLSLLNNEESIPAPSRMVINSIQQDCLELYSYIIATAMQVNKYGIAVSACEFVHFGLDSGFFQSANQNKVEHLKNKVSDAYYYIAARTGQYKKALYFNKGIALDHKRQLDRYLCKYPPSKPKDVKKNFALHNYLTTKSKELMVYVSTMDINNAISCINEMSQFKDLVPYKVKKSVILGSIKDRNPSLISSPTALNEVFKLELQSILKIDLTLSEDDIASLINDALKADGDTVIKLGDFKIEEAMFSTTEAIRALMRFKSLHDNGQLPNIFAQQVNKAYNKHFKSLHKLFSKISKSYDSVNRTFDTLYKYMTTSAMVRDRIIKKPNGNNRRIDLLLKLRGEMIALDWNRRLPTSWRNEIALEEIKIQLFLQDKTELDSRQKNLIFKRINNIVLAARKQKNPQTLSAALILLWVYHLNKGDEKQIKTSIRQELLDIANKYNYEYRKPEIEMLDRGIDPLQRLPL